MAQHTACRPMVENTSWMQDSPHTSNETREVLKENNAEFLYHIIYNPKSRNDKIAD